MNPSLQSKSRRMRHSASFAIASMFAITGLLVGAVMTGTLDFSTTSIAAVPQNSQVRPEGQVGTVDRGFAGIIKHVRPAIVNITASASTIPTQRHKPNPFDHHPFGQDPTLPGWDGFPMPQFPQPHGNPGGMGSGVIVSPNGYIVTNHHVIEGAKDVSVTLIDKREFTGRVIGSDSQTDLAVIKISGKNFPSIAWGDSSQLEIGEYVLAIGNPFGLNSTVTQGIVSGLGRGGMGITQYENFIQTDAAINPGNSGGPLVNLEGKAVGMNTAIFSRSGGYMGIGFAIPINMAKSIRTQLVEKGSVTRAYLGILVQQLTPELAKSFGLENKKGILVAQVTKDSPAEKAGMRRGDVIVAFEGRSVEKVGDFRNHIALKAPGTEEPITVIRDGVRKDLVVSLGELPENDPMAATSPRNEEKLGLAVQDLSADLARRFGYEGLMGVVVTQVTPGSVAQMAGIRPGALIQEANRKRITNTREFQRAVDQAAKKGTVLLLVREGDSTRFVALNVE